MRRALEPLRVTVWPLLTSTEPGIVTVTDSKVMGSIIIENKYIYRK